MEGNGSNVELQQVHQPVQKPDPSPSVDGSPDSNKPEEVVVVAHKKGEEVEEETERVKELRVWMKGKDGKNPEELAKYGLIGRFNPQYWLFGFLSPFVELGYHLYSSKTALKLEDVWETSSEDKIENLMDPVEALWDSEVEYNEVFTCRSEKLPSLVQLGAKWMGWELFFLFFLSGGIKSFSLIGPMFLQWLLGHVGLYADPATSPKTEGSGAAVYEGYLLSLTFLILPSVSMLFTAWFYHWMTRRFVQLRAAYQDMVYSKTLSITSTGRAQAESGKIVNLMSIDAERLSRMNMNWTEVLLVPIQLFFTFYFLEQELKKAVVAAVVVLLIFMPMFGVLLGTVIYLHVHHAKIQDKRMKLLNEVVQGIRIVKFYGWEYAFEKRIDRIREEELGYTFGMAYASVFFAVFFMLLPVTMTYFSFKIYDREYPLDPMDAGRMFKVLGWFGGLTHPLMALPGSIAAYAGATVASQRMVQYLLRPEVSKEYVKPPRDERYPLEIENGSFIWEHFEKPLFTVYPLERRQELVEQHEQKELQIKEELDAKSGRYNELEAKKTELEKFGQSLPRKETKELAKEKKIVDEIDTRLKDVRKILRSKLPILQNINCKFAKGSLTAIVGPVGAGKTSLLTALLNEMDCIGGTIYRPYSMSYASQKSWIQNMTVRDNILFSSPFEEEYYQKVIRACGLASDLDLLPSHDLTEIGERGINLSGGQKQRVALCRAIYARKEVLIMDDPLSAVDANVGKHIFQEAILGLCKDKTRVFVTNQLHYLPECDNAIVVDQGTIVESGSIRDLMSNKDSKLSHLMKSYLESVLVHENERNELPTEEITTLLKQVSEEMPDVESLVRRVSEPKEGEDLKYGHEFEKKQAADKDKVIKGTTKENIIVEEELYVGKVSGKTYMMYVDSLSSWAFWMLYPLMAVAAQGTVVLSSIILAFATVDAGVPAFLSALKDDYLNWYGYLLLGSVVAYAVKGFVWASSTVKAARIFHVEMARSVLKATTKFFDETPSGRIVNRFAKDVSSIDQMIPAQLDNFLSLTILVVFNLSAVCILIPLFLIPLSIAAILFYYVFTYYKGSAIQMGRLISIARSPVFHHFTETITGSETIRAFGYEQEFSRKFREVADINTNMTLSQRMVFRWAALRLGMLQAILAFGVAIITVMRAEQFADKLGFAGASINFTFQVGGLFLFLIMVGVELETAMNGVERVTHYTHEISHEPEFELDTDPKKGIWPSVGLIEFKDATFRYKDEPTIEPAMKNLTVTITPKEKIGVVGRTGSGKSTMMLTLFKLYGKLSSGKILIDGIDIDTLGLHTLRQRLALVPQDPVIFSGTIRDNLDPFNDYEDDEIWAVLKKIQLDAMVKNYEQRLYQPVAEYGGNLSAGQKQLLCMGRALLKKPKILLLDEATSSIDSKTDDKIQEVIRTEFKECTVLTIAHRLNTIMDSDRIIFLEKGVLKEIGSPKELLKIEKGRFRTMYESMTKQSQEAGASRGEIK